MKKLVSLIFVLLSCLFCYAEHAMLNVTGSKQITITPKYAVGDTIRYKANSVVTIYQRQDSMRAMIEYNPTIVVCEKNKVGYVLELKTEVANHNFQASTPELAEFYPDIESTRLFSKIKVFKLQLNNSFQPDSILNIAQLQETVWQVLLAGLAKQNGATAQLELNRETVGKLLGAVNKITSVDAMLFDEFCRIPYFTFIGKPIKTGMVAVTEVLCGTELTTYDGPAQLEMIVGGKKSNQEIIIQGSSDKSSVELKMTFKKGILERGTLLCKTKYESLEFVSEYTLERVR